MDSPSAPDLTTASQNGAFNPALIPLLAQLLQSQQNNPNALQSGQTVTIPAPGSASVPNSSPKEISGMSVYQNQAPPNPQTTSYGFTQPATGAYTPASAPSMSTADMMALQQGISQLVKTLQTQAPPTAPTNTIPAPTATPLPTITPYTPIAATPGPVPQVPSSFTASAVPPQVLPPPSTRSYVSSDYDTAPYQMPQGSSSVASASPSSGIRTDVNQATPVSNPPSIPVVPASSTVTPQSNALGGLSQQLARNNLPSAPGTVGSYAGSSSPTMDLGTLSNADISGASDASMASAMSNAAGSAGGGMSNAQIGGIVSGIQGIGQGIGQMFKGVSLPQLQLPPMAPMSNFGAPVMT